MNPDEAAQALQEIGHRQEQVIKLAIIPDWYWWVLAGLMLGLAAAADTRQPMVVGVGTTVFVLAVLASTGVMVRGALRAQVRNDLISARGVLAILGLVVLVLAVTLPTAFGLKAAGVAHPAVWGMLPGSAVMAAGGRWLTRYLRRLMLDNRIGTRRS
jgi:hypothetical protein